MREEYIATEPRDEERTTAADDRATDDRIDRLERRWGALQHGVVAFDADIRILWGNARLAALLDIELDDWRGKEPFSFVHPDDADRVLDSFVGLETFSGRRGPAVYRLVRSDGMPRQVVVSGLNLLDDPDWACMVLEVRDLDEDERAQALANDEYAVLERLVHQSTLTDTLNDIARLVERHGDGGDCVITLAQGATFHVAAAPNVPDDFVAALEGTPAAAGHLTMGEAVERQSEVVSPDLLHDPWWVNLRALVERHRYRSCWTVPILSSTDEGTLLGTVDFLRYETGEPRIEQWALYVLGARLAGLAIERASFVDALQHQARHDPLTGLLNRRAFAEELSTLGGDAPRSVAVLFLDLDRFKVVNDTHGHDLGDLVLCTVAERLATLQDDGATIARIGGDEFVLAWPDVAVPGTATKLAERARALVAEPMEHGLITSVATASVGTAIGTLGRDAPEQLIRDADAALYRAKVAGRNRCVFFDEQLRHAHLLRRETEHDLGGALDRAQLDVHFQPVVDLVGGDVVAIEALVRWKHPRRGLLLPQDFIGVAEDAGLIVDIDRWVLGTALRRAALWNERRSHPLTLWVNLSAVSLARPDTVAVLRNARAATPSVPLGIELTESAIHADRDAAIAALTELREAGLAIAIDDFGTGYSSLDALRWFPVTHIKIDKGFVGGVLTSAHDHAIVEASITLASALELTVTAEGIESPGQAEALTHLGCERGQGFLYSRALSADELEERVGPGIDRSWDAASGRWVGTPFTPLR